MVQILPPKTNIGSQIGQNLGSGLAQGMERANQYNFQRGNLQRALEGVKEVGQKPGANAFELATSLMEATAGIPGAERYVAQLFPMLLQQMALQPQGQQVGTLGEGGEQAGMPLGQGALQPQAQTPALVQDAVAKQMPPEDMAKDWATQIANGTLEQPLGADVTAGGNLPMYSREQIHNARVRAAQANLPDIQAKLMESYNASGPEFQKRYVETIEDRAKVADLQQRKDLEFAQYVQSRNPDMSPDDFRIFQDMARQPEALRAKTREDRYKVAEDLYNRYQSNVSQLEKSQPRGFLEGKDLDRYKKSLEDRVNWMVEHGQRDKAKALLTGPLSFGDAESELIINPLDKSNKSLLTHFPKLTKRDEDIGPSDIYEVNAEDELGYRSPESKAQDEKISKNGQRRRAQIKEYIPRLKKVIQPGTAREPGVSLVGVRKYAMDATGMEWEEFRDVINNLVSKNQIKLDPYQRQELNKLQSAPYPGLADWVMGRT